MLPVMACSLPNPVMLTESYENEAKHAENMSFHGQARVHQYHPLFMALLLKH
jgi:hypothetical protein